MSPQDTSNRGERYDLGELVQVDRVHLNVAQNIIVITEDRLKLHLSDAIDKTEKRNGWIAPLGIMISLLLTLVTTDFKNVGLKASVWQAIFILSSLLAFAWLVYAVRQALRSEGLDKLMEKIKASQNKS